MKLRVSTRQMFLLIFLLSIPLALYSICQDERPRGYVNTKYGLWFCFGVPPRLSSPRERVYIGGPSDSKWLIEDAKSFDRYKTSTNTGSPLIHWDPVENLR